MFEEVLVFPINDRVDVFVFFFSPTFILSDKTSQGKVLKKNTEDESYRKL